MKGLEKTMALIKKPVTGMKDILPEEMAIRDYLMNVIKDIYRSLDFRPLKRLVWSILKTCFQNKVEIMKS